MNSVIKRVMLLVTPIVVIGAAAVAVPIAVESVSAHVPGYSVDCVNNRAVAKLTMGSYPLNSTGTASISGTDIINLKITIVGGNGFGSAADSKDVEDSYGGKVKFVIDSTDNQGEVNDSITIPDCSKKITICHVDGQSGNSQKITISERAWENGSVGGHKPGAHGGDYKGECVAATTTTKPADTTTTKPEVTTTTAAPTTTAATTTTQSEVTTTTEKATTTTAQAITTTTEAATTTVVDSSTTVPPSTVAQVVVVCVDVNPETGTGMYSDNSGPCGAGVVCVNSGGVWNGTICVIELPATGSKIEVMLWIAGLISALAIACIVIARRRRPQLTD